MLGTIAHSRTHIWTLLMVGQTKDENFLGFLLGYMGHGVGLELDFEFTGKPAKKYAVKNIS